MLLNLKKLHLPLKYLLVIKKFYASIHKPIAISTYFRFFTFYNFLEIVLEESTPKKGQEFEHRRAAWKSIQKVIPAWLTNLVGQQPVEDRCKIAFQCLQFPVLNKQVINT